MPHRDDREAAGHRIAALERELEETRRRAEHAEAEARASRTNPQTPTKRTKERKRKPDSRETETPTSDPRWPPGALDLYRKLAGAAAIVHVPPALLTLAASDGELPIVPMGIAILAQIVITYVIGRAVRAPFPANGAFVLMIATPLILLGLVLGASDLAWGATFSEGPLRWLVRGACALVVLAVGALISATWTAEAASSDVSSD